jgi:hypothetical protein
MPIPPGFAPAFYVEECDPNGSINFEAPGEESSLPNQQQYAIVWHVAVRHGHSLLS